MCLFNRYHRFKILYIKLIVVSGNAYKYYNYLTEAEIEQSKGLDRGIMGLFVMMILFEVNKTKLKNDK